MQDWINQHFPIVFPFFFVGMWILAGYQIALTSGWRLLAKRFGFQGKFLGQKWTMQSARMRWLTNYNNVLTVGADNTGFFIVPLFLFRAWHPPLFVPWAEITAEPKTLLFFLKYVELRLGREEEIPFTIRASLAAKIEAAAGPGWPAGYECATALPPPPIG